MTGRFLYCPMSDLPVLLVTALDGSGDKAKGLEAGADDF
jgi:DNA-binding response OmpR family regulator